MAAPGDSLARRASKLAHPCKHRCGRPAAPRRWECEACRDRRPARVQKRRRYKARNELWGGGVGLSITPDEWQRLYHSQRGCCFICHKPLRNRYNPESTGQVAALDHDHALESDAKKAGVPPDRALRLSLRGLLCTYPCNRLLVRYWTPSRLARASDYVRTLPAQHVLGGD